MFIIYNNIKLLLCWHQWFCKISSSYKKFKDHCLSVPPYILPAVSGHNFCNFMSLEGQKCFFTQICRLRFLQWRVTDEAVLVLIVWGYARYVPVRTADPSLLTCFCQCDLVISTQTWNAEVDSRTEHRSRGYTLKVLLLHIFIDLDWNSMNNGILWRHLLILMNDFTTNKITVYLHLFTWPHYYVQIICFMSV